MIIAYTGKGGSGKSTLAALTIRAIYENKPGTSILAVDADPNTTLNYLLGVKLEKTVGDVREMLATGKTKPPEGVTTEDYLRVLINETIVETDKFDLIAMGRGEGPGCYCYVNHLLRKVLDELAWEYDYVVMDAEAGLEHISRRTTRDVDVMFIVVDPAARSVLTAKRIRELVNQLENRCGRLEVILNRVKPGVKEKLEEKVKEEGFEVAGAIPEDPLVAEFDLEGKPLTQLPSNSPAYKAVKEILTRARIL